MNYYTEVSGPYASCEIAVAAAVAINGNSSGCRYTFKPCCDVVGSPSYVAPFSTQGVVFSSFGHIINIGHGLIDSSGDPDICVSSFNYDNTVTIDNSQVSDYDTQIADNACDDSRCSRCVASVEPCDDSGVVISWVYNPQTGVDYSTGNVFSGSNINGYTTSSSYNVGISCVKVVTGTVTEGTMYTVSDGSGQQFGTHTSVQAQACGCRDGVRVKNGYADGGLMGGGTSVTYQWTLCGSSTIITYVLAAGNGVTTLYDIPGCIDNSSLQWTPTGANSGIQLPGDCCNGAT